MCTFFSLIKRQDIKNFPILFYIFEMAWLRAFQKCIFFHFFGKHFYFLDLAEKFNFGKFADSKSTAS